MLFKVELLTLAIIFFASRLSANIETMMFFSSSPVKAKKASIPPIPSDSRTVWLVPSPSIISTLEKFSLNVLHRA